MFPKRNHVDAIFNGTLLQCNNIQFVVSKCFSSAIGTLSLPYALKMAFLVFCKKTNDNITFEGYSIDNFIFIFFAVILQ